MEAVSCGQVTLQQSPETFQSFAVAAESSRRRCTIKQTYAAALMACCFMLGWLWEDPLPTGSSLKRAARRLQAIQGDASLVVPVVHQPELQGIRILAENEYTHTSPARHPLWRIIEPHKSTDLSVLDAFVGADESDSVTYSWSMTPAVVDGVRVNDPLAASMRLGAGGKVSWVFTAVGNVSVVVRASACSSCRDLRAQSPRRYAEFFAVRYVRREMRSLTESDVTRFFDAAETLYRMPLDEGRSRYDEGYQDAAHFVARHMRFAGRKSCDHWHEGPGFVTSHVALTLEFERALQAVDPAVTVPYWDYTLESTFYTPETWRTSRVFDPHWLGPPAPPDNVITEGRWAFVPTLPLALEDYCEPKSDDNADEIDDPRSTPRNAWGLMRAPWNLDSTPYMTRGSAIQGFRNNLKPRGCDAFDSCLRMDSWMELSMCLNTVAHGWVHELVGGSWAQIRRGEDASERFLRAVNMVAEGTYEFFHMALALHKLLWRADYVKCPSYCAPGMAQEDCRCSCVEDVIEEQGVYEVFRSAGLLAMMAKIDSNGVRWEEVDADNGEYVLLRRDRDATEAVVRDLLGGLCDSGYTGDMYSANSPNDISFWVLHPSLDRLWHRQRLAAAGLDLSESRSQDGGDDGGGSASGGSGSSGSDSALHRTSSSFEITLYNDTWEASHSCFGHNPEDETPFDSGIFAGVEAGRKLTNADIYRLMDPTGSTLPYVYDNFRWHHCEALGYVIRV